jgi:cellobiose phosphorylase
MTQYGYFDIGNREYVITNPRTPVKWINYIGTRRFGGFADHTGGAPIRKDDPTFNRITKYIQQMPSSDFKGETLYLRIKTGAGWKVLSPFFVPALDPYDRFECRVGLGYTRIISEMHGLRSDVIIFVPLDGLVEVRDIKITNLGTEPIEVDAIPLVEYTHPDALKQFTNADWVPQTMQSAVVSDGEFTILVQYPFMNRDRQINTLTSNYPASSFESDRKVFLGDNEYGTFRAPRAFDRPELNNSLALRGDNIGALMHHMGILQPGETARLITQLSQTDKLENALPEMRRLRDPQVVERELEKLGRFWDGYLSVMQVETPDENMNLMLNVFNPRQCYTTMTWSRYLSYYQPGLGARGIGIRDSSQDLISVLAPLPRECKEFLKVLLSFQRRDGSAMHQFNPLSLEGSVGDSIEMDDRPHYYSDDHLWFVLAASGYIKETGDLEFLSEIVPFYEKDKAGQPLENGTVLEHLKRSLAFTRKDVGRHGLPLLGFADWNDTVNLPTGAESLFSANLYGKALLEMMALEEFTGDPGLVEHQAAYDEMKARVENTAWDGRWYRRYYDAEGRPVGSSQNEYGKIYLNGQSWPVISGFAGPERAREAMDSVYRELNTKYGIKLSSPGFNGYDPRYGGVTTFPPGAKENGGIFLHPNPWAMIAETILGNGDRAYEYYSQINPAARNEDIEIYECEPYVYGQNVLGDEHLQFGLGRNSWLSGTASWCYHAATQWILGIRPELNGLRIDPCMPSSWDGFSVDRKFRGKILHIRVNNPMHKCKGVVKMTVDGNPLPGNILPADLPGAEHTIEINLGE